MLATKAISTTFLRDVVVVKDQTKHTTVGGVRSRSSLLGCGSSFLGRHDVERLMEDLRVDEDEDERLEYPTRRKYEVEEKQK